MSALWWFFIFMLVATPAVIVWTGRRQPEAIAEPMDSDFVGCIGRSQKGMKQGQLALVELQDHAGENHIVKARLEDAPEPVPAGQELLVIENPDTDGVVVVVPAKDIPRLEGPA